jgi:hypothetical protein
VISRDSASARVLRTTVALLTPRIWQPGSTFDTWNRAQVLVDGLQIPIGRVAMGRPRHHLEQTRVIGNVGWKAFPIGAEPYGLLELLPRQPRRMAVSIGRQVAGDERTKCVATTKVSRRVDHLWLPQERIPAGNEDSRG